MHAEMAVLGRVLGNRWALVLVLVATVGVGSPPPLKTSIERSYSFGIKTPLTLDGGATLRPLTVEEEEEQALFEIAYATAESPAWRSYGPSQTPTTSGPYYPSSGCWGAAPSTGGDFDPEEEHAVGPGTASCVGGTITATITYQGTSKAPDVTLVKETVWAGFSGDNGACNDGLGQSVTTGESGMVASVRWSVHLQEDTISVNVTPSASVAVSGAGFGVCEVWYRVEAFVPSIDFSGARDTSTSLAKILTGQKLIATTSIPEDLLANDNEFAWAVTGGRPFADYDPTLSTDQLSEWDVPSVTQSSMHAYFSEPTASPATVAVAVVLVAPDAPPTPVLGLPIEFELQRALHVDAPTSSLTAAVGGAALDNPSNPSSLRLTDPPDAGVIFVGWASTPEEYRSHGSGSWVYAQTVQSSDRRYWIGTSESPSPQNFAAPPKLDGMYPYAIGNYALGLGYTKDAEDSPQFAASGTFNSFGFTKVAVTDQFEMFSMYSAPNPHSSGQGTRPIALRKIAWQWAATAQYGTPWTIPNSSASSSAPVEFPMQPEWSGTLIGAPAPC